MSIYPEVTVAAAALLSFRHFSKLSWLSVHGARNLLQARRLCVGRLSAGKAPSVKESKEKVAIPGLDTVTYGEKMHFVPWLAKPVWPQWERDYKDPKHFRSPPSQEMPLYQETPCYVFNQRTSALEGVRQALWLTKSKAVSGLPPQLLSLAESPANKIPNQEIRVQNAIKHACFWDTTEEQPVKYSNTLLFNLLHLCATLQSSHPLIGRRMLTEKYILAASWKRGFRGQHFYPHAHTLYFLEGEDARCKLRPEQFRAKMIMFLFGNALAQAHTLFGAKTYQVLDHPITIQAVGTNGRLFQFIVFQLNTTDLSGDDGIKNQSVTRPLVDPLQFAYRANRSVDDSVNMGLHFILEHLDGAGTYARILFVDDCTSTHPAVKLLKTATWS
ncbi:39S ribosomal protein L37, mitochondrial isoform X6 [Phyllopteryx taeniolatus]|uniref:39S ribosomal protein L37, mitochondrial isoform X6 n=1 Tax=Phyllopteryx taeniolatus TaxID=161469 RepID=UPI002AD54D59|nr:39S ribosomal protein L37, mitochondrial isoform X6 [Phyllopteryx taeniolatus]